MLKPGDELPDVLLATYAGTVHIPGCTYLSRDSGLRAVEITDVRGKIEDLVANGSRRNKPCKTCLGGYVNFLRHGRLSAPILSESPSPQAKLRPGDPFPSFLQVTLKGVVHLPGCRWTGTGATADAWGTVNDVPNALRALREGRNVRSVVGEGPNPLRGPLGRRACGVCLGV